MKKGGVCIGWWMFVASVVVVAIDSGTLRADPFQNLDFEQATVQSASGVIVPDDAEYAIDSASALPHWIVEEDDAVCNAVWGAPVALDETSVTLVETGGTKVDRVQGLAAIQGKFAVQLYAYANAPAGYYHTASLSQTGDIPAGTQSIQFLVTELPIGIDFTPNPKVFLNGVSIPVFAQSSSNGVTTMVGDVSAFAGTTANLTIEAAGIPGQFGITTTESIFEVDAINFSTAAAPEPCTAAVLGVWALLCLGRRREKTSRVEGT